MIPISSRSPFHVDLSVNALVNMTRVELTLLAQRLFSKVLKLRLDLNLFMLQKLMAIKLLWMPTTPSLNSTSLGKLLYFHLVRLLPVKFRQVELAEYNLLKAVAVMVKNHVQFIRQSQLLKSLNQRAVAAAAAGVRGRPEGRGGDGTVGG